MTTANAAIPILDQAGRALGGFLPRLGGALVLLVVGLLLARVLGWATRRGLARIGVDDLSARLGVQPVLERAGLGSSLVRLLGRIVRIVVSIVAIFAALSLLGLQFLSQSLNQAVLALPELLIAAALVLVGIVLGGWVGERIERASYQMDLPLPLGRLAQVAVVTVFVITAAAQIAVPTIVLMVPIGLALATVGAAFALAFGLGGRDVARGQRRALRPLRLCPGPDHHGRRHHRNRAGDRRRDDRARRARRTHGPRPQPPAARKRRHRACGVKTRSCRQGREAPDDAAAALSAACLTSARVCCSCSRFCLSSSTTSPLPIAWAWVISPS